MQPNASNLIEVIPPPGSVRERLGQVLREAKILRRLLRVAEQAEREREQRKAVPGAR